MSTSTSNRTLHLAIVAAVGLVFSLIICLLYFNQMQSGCQIRWHFPSSIKESFVDKGVAVSTVTEKEEKPIVLLWFWPLGIKFDFSICKTSFNIDGCRLTDDRSLFGKANSVIIFHRNISWNLDNMPQGPRPQFQKWIWYNMDSPANTSRIPGLEHLFNLTLSNTRKASIPIRTDVYEAISRQDANFVLPDKDKLVCWNVSNDPSTGTDIRARYYQELVKHIPIQVYRAFNGSSLSYEEYYHTIGRCKFYLSFEDSIHRNYITEKINGPMIAGTVPVVLGPPRMNYEQFIPKDAIIHINDFPDAKALANYLMLLDENDESYMRYFMWRRHMRTEPHSVSDGNEFIRPICLACDHMSRDEGQSVIHDLYK